MSIILQPYHSTPSNITGSCNSCNGRIINLFSFTSNNCINNDTSATPFFNNQKIVARTGTISGCFRVNTPNFQAGSFVYTSDGVEGKCSLQTYQTEDCSDDFDRSIKVNADVSGCVSTSFQAVKLKC
jgi:hypothetical protein